MRRFTPWLWAISLFLLAAMTGMSAFDAGILVRSEQARFVLRQGILTRDDGTVRAGQSAPFPVRTCSYWEGFRTRNVPQLDVHASCPTIRLPK